MSTRKEQEHGLQLAQVEAIAAARLQGDARDRLIRFIRSYYENVPEDVLAALHPPDLFAIASGHHDFAGEREADGFNVRVYQPDAGTHGWSSDATVLETVVSDSPFLVDSILIAIRSAGALVRWLVHPVLAVRRDHAGTLQSVSGAAPGAALESLIHVQFDWSGDAKACEALAEAVHTTLQDLRQVVADYQPMREQLHQRIAELSVAPPGMDAEDIDELAVFLEWLDTEHFTFLGYSESRLVGTGEDAHFEYQPQSGLGLNRGLSSDEARVAPARELDKYASSRRPVIITKANQRSRIHHDDYLDSISVKRFDADGQVIGTCRFIGLFSNEVYNTLPRHIPVLRRKMDWVMRSARLRAGSHAAKQLQEILDGLPKDELFQSSEQELLELASGVRSLRETQQLRLFMRRDRYGRFFSCLVYLQRDRYSSEVRGRMGQVLMELLDGTDMEHSVSFQRDGLARLQFVVGTRPGSKAPFKVSEIEARLVEATRSWDDALRDTLMTILPDADARRLAQRFRGAFPASYREHAEPVDAATDLQYLNRLDAQEPTLVRLLEDPRGACDLRLKLYVRGEPAGLSAILPTLEHFGLTVLSQNPTAVRPDGGEPLWIQEFELRQAGVCVLATERLRSLFEDALLRVLSGDVEDDGFNGLILSAGLDWRQAALLRAIGRYLMQSGWPFSQQYVEHILNHEAAITADLMALFEASFDPRLEDDARDVAIETLEGRLHKSLDAIRSLDVDRVLRAYLSVISACLRSNYYQLDARGCPKPYISLKLKSALIAELPRPRPLYESFVYAPDMEGIHLRGGKVARGGLRWSDRLQDYRTEVLGLVKAQMVKNAIIVPVGAKGGFVVKRPTAGLDRDAVLAQGIECYKTFIRGLLDITDNLLDGAIRPPLDVVRLDDDDPYLVVAADKGTASFSDIANSVSAEYDFWLGDAFASGGSAGYDHKKMGITARGAWESVKRHFRELGLDCQSEDFTCVGIGDMAGDVFGNGMLLSPHIRLVAAFNHQHIFIDPEPDPARSFTERERLFRLPRSSWADYDANLISTGGGIYERSAKSIRLSDEARAALGIHAAEMTPTALIREILKAPVDLLWNGGIGTYVKSRLESHLDVGDRANDGLRVDGRELRCRVVGEGGNLGMTQLGRIEFALAGGRVITDFNDNAGGVNSSDREVNIKIPLNRLMHEGRLELAARNSLLESMTEDVAAAVLRDSYQQTQALARMQQQALDRLGEQASLIRMLERDDLLDRAIEFLPDEERIAERRAARQGLTAPEQAVLLSYAKIALYTDVLESALPDDGHLQADLLDYFPSAMRATHEAALRAHHLRREIIATIVTNQLVNRMGPAFVHRVADERGYGRDLVVRAYVAAREIFCSESRFGRVEMADGQIDSAVQYRLMDRVTQMLKHAVLWYLRNTAQDEDLAAVVPRFAAPLKALEAELQAILPPAYRQHWDDQCQSMLALGASPALAEAHAHHALLGAGLDIALLVETSGFAVNDVARVYFRLGEHLSMPWLIDAVNGLDVSGPWQAMARNNMREDCTITHRQLVAAVLDGEEPDAEARLDAWLLRNAAQLERAGQRLKALEALPVNDFASLTIALGELQRLSL